MSKYGVFSRLYYVLYLDWIQENTDQKSFVFGQLLCSDNVPSKHVLVLKTSSTRLQRNNFSSSKTSWKRLQDVSQRRKIVSLKTSSRRLEDISWKRLEELSWRRLEDMSWRPYREKQNTYWGCNKSKYISDKSIFLKSVSGNSKANPKRINYNTITSPFLLFWDSRSISIVRIEISDDWFDVVKSAEFKLEIAEKVRQ